MIASSVKRASCLTLFSVAVLISVSLFANRPTEDDDINLPTNETNSIVDSDLGQRRTLGNVNGLDLLTVDAELVKQAEAVVHAWLNSKRRENCKTLRTYTEAGKVHLAAQNFSQGKQQVLLEVKYSTEVFFARVSVAEGKLDTGTQIELVELVPGPCETGFKNGLAVTAEGMFAYLCDSLE